MGFEGTLEGFQRREESDKEWQGGPNLRSSSFESYGANAGSEIWHVAGPRIVIRLVRASGTHEKARTAVSGLLNRLESYAADVSVAISKLLSNHLFLNTFLFSKQHDFILWIT